MSGNIQSELILLAVRISVSFFEYFRSLCSNESRSFLEEVDDLRWRWGESQEACGRVLCVYVRWLDIG